MATITLNNLTKEQAVQLHKYGCSRELIDALNILLSVEDLPDLKLVGTTLLTLNIDDPDYILNFKTI